MEIGELTIKDNKSISGSTIDLISYSLGLMVHDFTFTDHKGMAKKGI